MGPEGLTDILYEFYKKEEYFYYPVRNRYTLYYPGFTADSGKAGQRPRRNSAAGKAGASCGAAAPGYYANVRRYDNGAAARGYYASVRRFGSGAAAASGGPEKNGSRRAGDAASSRHNG
jgi:hypothetical protein